MQYPHSSYTSQLLRMIIDEQHDLQKAKESIYILQRGLSITLILLTFRTKLGEEGVEGVAMNYKYCTVTEFAKS